MANTYLEYPLRIYPRVNLRHIPNSQCSVKFDTEHNDVIIKGVLQRSGLMPGETTTFSIDIFNPLHLMIKRMDICLIQRYEIAQFRRRLEITRVPVPQLTNFDDQHVETTCLFTVPMGISPTYYFERQDNRYDIRVKVKYDIRFEVKAKGLFTNFDLQIPIIIGTHSELHTDDIHQSAIPTPIDLNSIDQLEFQTTDDNEQTC